MSGTAARIGALDSLRGVAILAVVASHFLPHLPAGALQEALIGLGRGGVILFFLLSGYLIFRNIERQPVPQFLCRRLFKILPPFWVNVAVILLLDRLLQGAGHHPTASYIASTLMVSDLLRVEPVSGVYWTLLIEAKFYLFIALHHALLRGRGTTAVFLGLVATNLLAWTLRGQGSLLLTFFPTFYIGIAVRQAEQAGWGGVALARLVAMTGLLAAGMAVTLDQFPLWSAAYLLLGTLLLVWALRRGLSSAPLGWLGQVSYSGYLYHPLVGAALFAAVPAGGLLTVAAAGLASALVAWLFYRTVEVPAVALGRRVEGPLLRLLARGRPAVQAA